MSLETSDKSVLNSSGCGHDMRSWEESMDKMYTYFYLLVFVPGLLLNTTALWVLCRHISKKTKAVIFMINLALADLAHILSLPLRIYYYFSHTWPFGHGVCLFCFYLKYLNMYAAIVFLMCISVQRCVFLLKPFSARRWRRRYDLAISALVWVVVGVACSPFILMRSSDADLSVQAHSNTSLPEEAASTHQTSGFPAAPLATSPSPTQAKSSSCFKDLPMRHLSPSLAATMITLAELFGFLIPLACVGYSSFRIARSLHQRRDEQISSSLSPPSHRRLQSVSSACQGEKEQSGGEKRRALRMVLACTALFLFCFGPYHISFMLYLMVSQGMVSHCATTLAVRRFHPISLCLSNLSCILNPLLYYFLTAEFRMHLTKRTQSFSSVLSSPVTSPTHWLMQQRLMSTESSCSEREQL
ncbi:putative P2Y purinoceptor 10 [Salarias fasciatus]|uniref:Putative P2Y purinoceptor 10 n=1 Tax=Salarias fasciatus TaxID=181472 RepID=A0A672HRG9_SALFA|nr:putative P2Y purinoceptor 10 [Salarias fasciatus]